MEESLLDITANSADTDCEERPVNGYGSPIVRRSSGDVGVQAIGAIFCIHYLHNPIIHLFYPPKILHNHCCKFSWDMKMS